MTDVQQELQLLLPARWIKKKNITTNNPKRLIIAIPVAPKETLNLLKNEADYMEVITSPSTYNFKTVGQYYQDFNPVTDDKLSML